MAKIYGGRWQLTSSPPLGTGGQGTVFRVIDIRGEYPGEYALKRVLNPERHDRFEREIEAIKTIQHPNVVRLIDHSALTAASGEVEKQFLVTPIAEGGDLSQPGRVAIYKDSIDSVVQVGKQLSAALGAAHVQKVIHRDVKPENVLFTGNGHEIWLGDFGICLLRGRTRLTEADEKVGPHSFLAPELDDGGQLDATPAADVYSLGKVLYFMISGGVILPRERLADPKFNFLLVGGERHRLMYSLLEQMICDLPTRLKTMKEVNDRLMSIETWEKRAQLLPLNQEALAGIQQLQVRAQENVRSAKEATSAREEEQKRLENARLGFEAWVRSELEKVIAHINSASVLNAQIYRSKNADIGWHFQFRSTHYQPIGGLGLLLESNGVIPAGDVLYFGLFQQTAIKVTVSVLNSGATRNTSNVPEPPRDFQLAMVPICRGTQLDSVMRRTASKGFFTKKAMIGQLRGVVSARGRAPYVGPTPSVTDTFSSESSQFVHFRVSDWPQIVTQLDSALQEALASFIKFVSGS